jgi:WD40 repeat protein
VLRHLHLDYEPIAIVQGHDAPVLPTGVLMADGRAVTLGADIGVRFWRSDGASIGTARHGHHRAVRQVRFAPRTGTSSVLYSAGDDGAIYQWDTVTGRAIGGPWLPLHQAGVTALDVHPQHGWIISGGVDGTLRLRDGPQGGLLSEQNGLGNVSALRFTPEGRRVLSLNAAGKLTLWSVSERCAAAATPASAPQDGCLRPLGEWPAKTPGSIPLSLEWTDAAGTRLLTGASDGTLSLWSLQEGRAPQRLRNWPLVADSGLIAIAASRNGRRLAAGSEAGEIWLMDMEAGNSTPAERRWSAHDGAVRDLAFGADGELLASCGDDGRVRLWDGGTGNRLEEIHEADGPLYALDWDQAGARLAYAGADAPDHAGAWIGIAGNPIPPDRRACLLAGRKLSAEEGSALPEDVDAHAVCETHPPSLEDVTAGLDDWISDKPEIMAEPDPILKAMADERLRPWLFETVVRRVGAGQYSPAEVRQICSVMLNATDPAHPVAEQTDWIEPMLDAVIDHPRQAPVDPALFLEVDGLIGRLRPARQRYWQQRLLQHLTLWLPALPVDDRQRSQMRTKCRSLSDALEYAVPLGCASPGPAAPRKARDAGADVGW